MGLELWLGWRRRPTILMGVTKSHKICPREVSVPSSPTTLGCCWMVSWLLAATALSMAGLVGQAAGSLWAPSTRAGHTGQYMACLPWMSVSRVMWLTGMSAHCLSSHLQLKRKVVSARFPSLAGSRVLAREFCLGQKIVILILVMQKCGIVEMHRNAFEIVGNWWNEDYHQPVDYLKYFT